MNVVREINKINDLELKLGSTSASWHEDYKDSAYIHVSGLDYGLTEGDVIVIFSQYGEVMDVNMPKDKNTGKSKGFAFLMYEDQRSTVLAVDNLSGANVVGRTLKVDHVRSYRQPKIKNEEGELVDPEFQTLNAKPELVHDDGAMSESSESSAPSIDPEDPMRDYLLQQRREEKEKKKKKSKSKSKSKETLKKKSKHMGETPEERRARKERKKSEKALKARERSTEKPERNRTPPRRREEPLGSERYDRAYR